MVSVKVKGDVRLSGDFEVQLNITKEEFESLTLSKKKDLIDEHMDWENLIVHGGSVFDIKVVE